MRLMATTLGLWEDAWDGTWQLTEKEAVISDSNFEAPALNETKEWVNEGTKKQERQTTE